MVLDIRGLVDKAALPVLHVPASLADDVVELNCIADPKCCVPAPDAVCNGFGAELDDDHPRSGCDVARRWESVASRLAWFVSSSPQRRDVGSLGSHENRKPLRSRETIRAIGIEVIQTRLAHGAEEAVSRPNAGWVVQDLKTGFIRH